MKAHYRVNQNLTIEIEGGNQKELFKARAQAAEVFGEQWERCGACKSEHRPVPVVRENKGFTFYEMHCTNPQCRARFAFGQNKDMKTLFPQRKFPGKHPEAGKYKPNGGWMVWRSEDDEFAD